MPFMPIMPHMPSMPFVPFMPFWGFSPCHRLLLGTNLFSPYITFVKTYPQQNMSTNRIPIRVVVHTKDVENITGLMPRTARKLLQSIRLAFGLPKGALISVRDFCAYTGIEEDLIRDYLKV